MLRTLFLAGVAVCAAGCATGPDKASQARMAPLTPASQYPIKVNQSPDEILLAAHASGLSARQVDALADLVGRWRESGGKAISVTTPAGGGPEAELTADAVRRQLEGQGVATSLIHVAAYDPAEHPGAPVVVVGFTRYEAAAINCGRTWQDFTRSSENLVSSNFGCSVSANIGTQVANAADLVEPRPMDPPDAARREVALGKYRQGVVTSAAKDDQATGAISTVVH